MLQDEAIIADSPVPKHLRADAGVVVLLGVSGLDSHTNGNVATPRL
jgi:hypothetical protein